jgi:hypothetical protein
MVANFTGKFPSENSRRLNELGNLKKNASDDVLRKMRQQALALQDMVIADDFNDLKQRQQRQKILFNI